MWPRLCQSTTSLAERNVQTSWERPMVGIEGGFCGHVRIVAVERSYLNEDI